MKDVAGDVWRRFVRLVPPPGGGAERLELRFGGVKLGEAGVAALCRWLAGCLAGHQQNGNSNQRSAKTICWADFSSTDLGDRGLARLAACFEFLGVEAERLWLNDGLLSPAAAPDLTRLAGNPHLQDLRLAGNELDDDASLALLSSMATAAAEQTQVGRQRRLAIWVSLHGNALRDPAAVLEQLRRLAPSVTISLAETQQSLIAKRGTCLVLPKFCEQSIGVGDIGASEVLNHKPDDKPVQWLIEAISSLTEALGDDLEAGGDTKSNLEEMPAPSVATKAARPGQITEWDPYLHGASSKEDRQAAQVEPGETREQPAAASASPASGDATGSNSGVFGSQVGGALAALRGLLSQHGLVSGAPVASEGGLSSLAVEAPASTAASSPSEPWEGTAIAPQSIDATSWQKAQVQTLGNDHQYPQSEHAWQMRTQTQGQQQFTMQQGSGTVQGHMPPVQYQQQPQWPLVGQQLQPQSQPQWQPPPAPQSQPLPQQVMLTQVHEQPRVLPPHLQQPHLQHQQQQWQQQWQQPQLQQTQFQPPQVPQQQLPQPQQQWPQQPQQPHQQLAQSQQTQQQCGSLWPAEQSQFQPQLHSQQMSSGAPWLQSGTTPSWTQASNTSTPHTTQTSSPAPRAPQQAQWQASPTTLAPPASPAPPAPPAPPSIEAGRLAAYEALLLGGAEPCHGSEVGVKNNGTRADEDVQDDIAGTADTAAITAAPWRAKRRRFRAGTELSSETGTSFEESGEIYNAFAN